MVYFSGIQIVYTEYKGQLRVNHYSSLATAFRRRELDIEKQLETKRAIICHSSKLDEAL